ncbi:MAG: hypothetical protein HY903_11120 [Deltaproteobacteria bacterium]|nr:hypothetical protein [Deltaproteobacteria bacterium]
MHRPHLILVVALGSGLTTCRSPAPVDRPPDPTLGRTWQDEVIYQLLTDRFANGDSTNDAGAEPSCGGCYHGGDWRGVASRLDYLQTLGVTAIWISPVVANIDTPSRGQAYHGYWPLALDRVNERFGTLDDLQALVAAAHARGIKVIADVVLNHLGPVAFYDLNGNGVLDETGGAGDPANELSPPFDPQGVKDQQGTLAAPFLFFPAATTTTAGISPAVLRAPAAFHRRGLILDYNEPAQSLTGDFRGGLRDLDTSDPAVEEALVDLTLAWDELVGFDGYRYDAAKHVEDAFWRVLLPALRDRRGPPPDAGDGLLQFPEVLDGRPDYLATFTRPEMFDTVLDFASKFRVFDEVFKHGGPASAVLATWRETTAAFPSEPQIAGISTAPAATLLRFLDNHDLPRFLSENPSIEALHAALAYLVLGDGVPVIYYGTEQAFAGGTDPGNREDLSRSGYATDGATFRFLQTLIGLRRTYVALRRGDTRFVWASEHTGNETDAGVLAFERVAGGERLLVVINTHATKTSDTTYLGETLQVGFAPGTVLVDLLAGDHTRYVVAADGGLRLSVPPHGARLLAPVSP